MNYLTQTSDFLLYNTAISQILCTIPAGRWCKDYISFADFLLTKLLTTTRYQQNFRSNYTPKHGYLLTNIPNQNLISQRWVALVMRWPEFFLFISIAETRICLQTYQSRKYMTSVNASDGYYQIHLEVCIGNVYHQQVGFTAVFDTCRTLKGLTRSS